MHKLEEIQYLENSLPEMRKHLTDWSNTNSGSYNLAGIELMQEKIKSLFANLNADIKQHQAKPYEVIDQFGQKQPQKVGDVIHIIQRPHAKKQIILCGHCDTVFAKDDSFQSVSVRNDNILNGPGVSDMKGGLLVMYYALQALEQSDKKNEIGWQVFINADEEIGSIGSSPILSKISKNVDYGFVYEPALDDAGTLAYQRNGSGNFTLTIYGQAAHVGREFEKGKSAVVGAAELVQKLHALNNEKDLIVNVANIHSSGPLNQVPDFAQLRLNVRISTIESEQLFLDKLQQIIQQSESLHQLNISQHGQFTRKPKIIDEKAKRLYDYVLQQANTLNMPLATKGTGGCCDGNNLSALGIPNVDTLGVYGGKIHTHEEYILLDSLVKRAKLSAMIYQGIANGDLS